MNYEYLKDIIVNANDEIAAAAKISKTLGHDPFEGHNPSDPGGKSKFAYTSDNDYVGDYSGECNAYDAKPAKVRAELVTTVRDDDSVKLFVYRLVPTHMVEETFGGHGIVRKATDEEADTAVSVGFWTKTRRPTDEELIVDSVHGCLQLAFFGDEYIVEEAEADEYTVCLTKEDAGWALASVYPGRPDGDIGEFLANAEHYCSASDKDNGINPVHGYSEGDRFDPDLLVEPAPEWIYDHIVIR